MVCGCTDEYGCAGGCWWVDDWHVLCSRCARNMAVFVLAQRARIRAVVARALRDIKEQER